MKTYPISLRVDEATLKILRRLRKRGVSPREIFRRAVEAEENTHARLSMALMELGVGGDDD